LLEKDAPETRVVQSPELGSVVELPEVADCIIVMNGERPEELFSN
jgi:hypothetical protein